MVREIRKNELYALLDLYTHLHETEVPDNSEHLKLTWDVICDDPNHHIIVFEENGKIVSSCVLVLKACSTLTAVLRMQCFSIFCRI